MIPTSFDSNPKSSSRVTCHMSHVACCMLHVTCHMLHGAASHFQVPEGFETDEKMNTDLRPSEATLEDYKSVPIEQFGLAMLRGMGWAEGEGKARIHYD